MVTFMPSFTVLYSGSMGLMEGRPIQEIKHRWQTVCLGFKVISVISGSLPLSELPYYRQEPMDGLCTCSDHKYGCPAFVRKAAVHECHRSWLD